MSILDQAQPVSDTQEAVTVLLYGASGAGKTRFLGSGRENGKNDLIIAVENGTVSASRAGSQANVIKPKNWAEMEAIVKAIEDEPDRFEWVCLDSLTQLQDFIWDCIIEEKVANNPSRSRYTRELQEYGENQARTKAVVSRLIGSGANVIFTATEDLDVDEEGNKFKLPSIHGKNGALAMWCAAKPDIVGHLTVAKNPSDGQLFRRFQFFKTPGAIGKDRFDVFTRPQANLTLEKFTDILLAAGQKES